MKNVNELISSSGVGMPRIIYGTAWKKEQTEALVIEAKGRKRDSYDKAGGARCIG